MHSLDMIATLSVHVRPAASHAFVQLSPCFASSTTAPSSAPQLDVPKPGAAGGAGGGAGGGGGEGGEGGGRGALSEEASMRDSGSTCETNGCVRR